MKTSLIHLVLAAFAAASLVVHPIPGLAEATAGPLPGDVGLYTTERACTQARPTPGYHSSMNGAEISDAERSGVFPCATFTGAMDGANQVFASRSTDDYPGISYINTGEPGELYIVGGEFPTPEIQLQAPYVAKADAATGTQIWRTYLDNADVSGRWIGNANLNILENGRIAFAWSNRIVLLDAATGEVLNFNILPTGEAPAEDVNFKHLTVAPDGTLILKNQSRPIGCKVQGTMGIIQCSAQGMQMPNSILVAVDPATLEVLDQLQLPEPAATPHIVTSHGDKIAIYLGMTQSARRYYWDPKSKKLSPDETWIARPLAPGQTAMTAPSLVGEWIGFQTNGLFSNEVASSVVVIHADDASRTETVYPFGETLAPGEWSFAPPKAGADPENHMIYSVDMGMKKVAGIKIDPATGKLTTAFVVDTISNTFQPVIGPKDARVLLLTSIELPASLSVQQAVFTLDKYKEQLTWRDAATGEVLAASEFFEPLTINSLTTPGFGGRVYYPTAVGKGFYVLQVAPKPEAPAAE